MATPLTTTTTKNQPEEQQKNRNEESKQNECLNQSISIPIDWKHLPLVILYKIFSNLTSEDRLNASSTCSLWRNVIYHSSLWPRKHLKVNLCPHKFSLKNNNDNDHHHLMSGFHTYKLRDSFVYQQHLQHTVHRISSSSFRNDNNSNINKNNQRKPSRKNFNEQLKSFIRKCSRFLTGISFYFDPNSSHNVLDLIKIIKFLSENEVAVYELNETRKNFYANCRNLKYFSIVPVTTLVRCANDQRFMSLYSGLTEAIRFLFSKCHQLEHISLGQLHELIHATDLFFGQFSKTGVDEKLQCLHLSTIKGDIFRYIPQRSTLEHLERFQQLKNVSFDFDVVDSRVISILSRIESLKTLTINVHRFNRNHPGITKETWQRTVRKLPELNVTLNLLHTENFNGNFRQIIMESLINTEMPLKNFRAYYLEFNDDGSSSMYCNMLDVLSRIHNDHLESVILIENINNPKNYLKFVSPNVLVMLTWRCKNLKNLTVIGQEITDIDIIAMARLRGETLQTFRFPASCIQLTRQYSKYNTFGINEYQSYFDLAPPSAQRFFNDEVSIPLKRNWKPTLTSEIPDIITTGFLPQTIYHRTIIEQQQCGQYCMH